MQSVTKIARKAFLPFYSTDRGFTSADAHGNTRYLPQGSSSLHSAVLHETPFTHDPESYRHKLNSVAALARICRKQRNVKSNSSYKDHEGVWRRCQQSTRFHTLHFLQASSKLHILDVLLQKKGPSVPSE